MSKLYTVIISSILIVFSFQTFAEENKLSEKNLIKLEQILSAVGYKNATNPQNLESIYSKKATIELGEQKFIIPKAFIEPYDIEDHIKHNSSKFIELTYSLPHNKSLVEHFFLEDKPTQLDREGRIVHLQFNGENADLNDTIKNLEKSDIIHYSKYNMYGLKAYFSSDRTKKITHSNPLWLLEYDDEKNIIGFLLCESISKKVKEEPHCQNEKQDSLKAELYCHEKEQNKNIVFEPDSCTHIFNNKEYGIVLRWSSDKLPDWKQQKENAISFMKQFEVEDPKQ